MPVNFEQNAVHPRHRVSRETLLKLEQLVALVQLWNRRLNLVASGDVGDIWERHIWDSCQLLPLLPSGIASAVDLGSGAGFPGLVLAIAADTPFVLVESDRRKSAFLREAARITATLVTVASQRAETLTCKVDLVTARAMAPLPRLLEWTYRILKPTGLCLFPKGRLAGAEIADARLCWEMQVQQLPSVTAPDASILVIRHLAPK